MMTTVYTLGGQVEQVFNLPPKEAVIAAYEQSKGNYNTWTYPDNPDYLVWGKRTVCAGNFAALKLGYYDGTSD